MLELLGLFGPATATQLAAKVGESSGATSYHLRQLARYGFIEEDPGRGSGRERWWRRVRGGLSLNTHELADDPAAQEAATLVAKEWNRSRQARFERWQTSFDAWPEEWINASSSMSVHLRLTPGELAELTDELDQLTTRWAVRAQDRDHDERYTDVEMQAAAFPLGDPPTAP